MGCWLGDCLKRRLTSVVTRLATRTVVACQAGSGAEIAEGHVSGIFGMLPLMLICCKLTRKAACPLAQSRPAMFGLRSCISIARSL